MQQRRKNRLFNTVFIFFPHYSTCTFMIKIMFKNYFMHKAALSKLSTYLVQLIVQCFSCKFWKGFRLMKNWQYLCILYWNYLQNYEKLMKWFYSHNRHPHHAHSSVHFMFFHWQYKNLFASLSFSLTEPDAESGKGVKANWQANDPELF